VKVEAMSGELWVGVIIFYAWGWDESVKASVMVTISEHRAVATNLGRREFEN